MRANYIFSILTLFSIFNPANSDELAGSWKFDKAKEYFGSVKNITPPKYSTIQIVSGKLGLSPTCTPELKMEDYDYSDPFQMLIKADVDEKTLDKYLQKNFSFSLSKIKYVYNVERMNNHCNDPFSAIFVLDDKLIVQFASSYFYSYTRLNNEIPKTSEKNIIQSEIITSQLPFNVSNFSNLCAPLISKKNGMPEKTAKCAPVYYPYVAKKTSTNPLIQLIGMHDYLTGGSENAQDYQNPFSHNLHPIFMQLPSFKDVILFRVEDFEPGPNENRDTIAGVYLTVKDGKIVDQLNEGCNITSDYFCVDDNGAKQFQLLESGKFKKLN